MNELTEKQRKDIYQLIKNGQKVQAIKYIIDHTGDSLKQAKMLAEHIEQQPFSFLTSPTEHSSTEQGPIHIRLNEDQLVDVIELVQDDKKIEAIKYLVEHGRYSLKEAKSIVDLIEQKPEQIDLLLAEEEDAFFQEPSTAYRSVQVDYAQQKMYILYENGLKEQIDEHHPKWNDITMMFYRKNYPSIQACLADLQQRRSEMDSSLASPPVSTPAVFPTQPDTPQIQGIEDQTRKKDLSKIIVVICIIAIIAGILLIR